VQDDPRIQLSDADRAKWNETLMKAYQLQRSAQAAQRSAQNLRTQVTALQDSLRSSQNVPREVNDAVRSLSGQIDDLLRKMVQAFDNSGSAGPPLPDAPRPIIGRVGQLFNGLDSYTAVPTPDQSARLSELTSELKGIIDQLNKLIEESVPNLNKQIRDSGLTYVNPGQRVAAP